MWRRSVVDLSKPQRFTARQKMQCAQRETGYRRFVYPKRVVAGKMTQADADKQIAIMDEIAADYGTLAKKEELPL
jgi:hypothetical protein